MRSRFAASIVLLATALVIKVALAPADPDPVPSDVIPLALDHANVVVGDLGAAVEVFENLGFTLKRGRPHANSIANQHCKFLDGTEIELITAAEPRDSLAAEYLGLIARGDGGAFAALRCDGLDSLVARLDRLGDRVAVERTGFLSATFPPRHPLRFLWFLHVPRVWVDRPEYTTHANTAQRLRAVWCEQSLEAEVLRLCATLGYTARAVDWPLPGSQVIALEAGEIYVVPVESPHGGVAGATIEVLSLQSVEAVLQRAGIAATRAQDLRGNSLLVAPTQARGIWLEFLEPTKR